MAYSKNKSFAFPSPKQSRHQQAPGQTTQRKQAPIDPRDLGTVGHDDLGNAVWQWHPKVPGRDSEDPTIDYLEALDIDELSIEDDADEAGSRGKHEFNPYDHD